MFKKSIINIEANKVNYSEFLLYQPNPFTFKKYCDFLDK